MSLAWTGRDEQDVIRWYSAGMSRRVIGDSLSPRRSQFEVTEKLRELGYLREQPPLRDEQQIARARAALAQEVRLGRAEILSGTAPPYKGEIAWPK